MPLVPLSQIERWYKADSLIYRSYAYLHINPCWQGKIPAGASVCAYFWSAMFSMLLFRPFILPLIRTIRWTVRVIGIEPAFKAFDGWIHHLTLEKDSGRLGVNTVNFFMTCCGILGICGTIYFFYYVASLGHTVGTFWAGAVLLTSIVALAYIEDKTSLLEIRARQIFWTISGCIVGTMAYLYPDAMRDVFVFIGTFVWGIISPMLGGARYYWPVYLTGAAFLLLATYLGHRFNWMYLDYADYQREWRLRPARKMVRDWLFHQLISELCDKTYAQQDDWAHETPTRVDWIKHVTYSVTLSDAIYDLVSEDLWINVKIEHLHISISQARIDQMVNDIYTEALAIHKEKVAAIKRRTEKPSIFKTFGTQVLTFGCYMWELAKARKQGVCPYLPLENPTQPPEPHV